MSKKVLIVDNNPDFIDTTTKGLENKGFTVISALSTADGLDKFCLNKPDIVISTLMIEHYDSGFIFAYKIKKHDKTKKVPVLILTDVTYQTGYKFDVSTPEEKEWLKCEEIINKPISIPDLVNKINFYLEESPVLV